MKKAAFAFLFTLSFSLAAQVRIDSIQKAVNAIATDTARITKLNKLSSRFIDSSEFQIAKMLADQAIILSKKIKSAKGEATGLNNLGIANWYQGNLTEALNKYLEAIKLFEKIGDPKSAADSYGNIGIIYAMQENYKEAISCQLKALKLDEAANDKQGLAYVYNNLGLIYYYQKNYPESLKNHQLALGIKQQIGDQLGMAASLDNMGVLYDETGEYDKALESYLKSFGIVEALGNEKGMVSSYNNIGSMYVRKKNYEEAKKYFFNALQLARKIGMKESVLESCMSISNVAELQGDFKNAFQYYRTYSETKDTLFNQENTKKQAKLEAKFDFDKKTVADSVKNYEQNQVVKLKHDQEIKQQRVYTFGGIIGFCLMMLVAIVLFRSNKQKQKANREIEHQKNVVEEKQKEIVDSINYARRIQFTLLAHDEVLKKNLTDHFILFKPKDIVSGDFYWATEKDSLFYFAVCDSTGHGVPGAFMSLLNLTFLNEAINEKNISEPHHVRKRLIENISQDGGQDGMDAILICIDRLTKKVTYAAAHNSPILIKNNELVSFPADKMPVGKGVVAEPFRLFEMDVQKNDVLYLLTDGYADQFGGDKGKKFKYKQLNELLLSIHDQPMMEQQEKLNSTIEKWKGNLEQVDDICIVGMKI